jgi:hypothetical protein
MVRTLQLKGTFASTGSSRSVRKTESRAFGAVGTQRACTSQAVLASQISSPLKTKMSLPD